MHKCIWEFVLTHSMGVARARALVCPWDMGVHRVCATGSHWLRATGVGGADGGVCESARLHPPGMGGTHTNFR